MPIKKELLEILACPVCKGNIIYKENENYLQCEKCNRKYPIENNIPVMLAEKAIISETDKRL